MATWTMQSMESALGAKTRELFVILDWDYESSGTNGHFAGPIRDALLLLEYSVADLSQPVDADLSSVATTDSLKLLEVAETFLLEQLYNNLLALSDIQVGLRDEKFGQISEKLGKRLMDRRQAMQEKYGLFYGVPVAGHIGLNFQTKGNDEYPTSWE